MALEPKLLEVICCPACHADLVYREEIPALDCEPCKKRFPIKDDIPVLLVSEAVGF